MKNELRMSAMLFLATVNANPRPYTSVCQNCNHIFLETAMQKIGLTLNGYTILKYMSLITKLP